MCTDYSKNCTCGQSSASFNFRDNILPLETVASLYCPICSKDVIHDTTSMLSDNGWIIEFDMEAARFMMQKTAPASNVTPEFLFDEGYCTWRGIYPGDHIDSLREREELMKLAKTDKKRYFDEFRTWGTRRMARLAQAGWRKAFEREPAKM